MRKPLRNRRANVTTVIKWTSKSQADTKLIVTYGLDRAGKIKEAFCAGFRAETDICALANDACIMMSLLLQHGIDITYIAEACGENKPAQAETGTPASLLGAIAKEGVVLQNSDHAKQAAAIWNKENE